MQQHQEATLPLKESIKRDVQKQYLVQSHKEYDASSAYRVINTTARKLYVKATATVPTASYNSVLCQKIKNIVQNVEGFELRIRKAYTDLLNRTVKRFFLPVNNRSREVVAVAILCDGINLKNLQTQEELLRLLMDHNIDGNDVSTLGKWVVDMGWYEYPVEKTTKEIIEEINQCAIQQEVKELLTSVDL